VLGVTVDPVGNVVAVVVVLGHGCVVDVVVEAPGVDEDDDAPAEVVDVAPPPTLVEVAAFTVVVVLYPAAQALIPLNVLSRSACPSVDDSGARTGHVWEITRSSSGARPNFTSPFAWAIPRSMAAVALK
jgi:hypothetical protein